MTTNQVLAPAAGGLTLGVGVYSTTSGLTITGTLTLDCQLKSAPVFIFQIATTLNVANNGQVVYINKLAGATAPKAVNLVGTVMAYQSVSVGTGSSTGPLMGDNGAVTLLTNVVKSRFVTPDNFIAAIHHAKYRVVSPKSDLPLLPSTVLIEANLLPSGSVTSPPLQEGN
eukprot:gene39246-48477_t